MIAYYYTTNIHKARRIADTGVIQPNTIYADNEDGWPALVFVTTDADHTKYVTPGRPYVRFDVEIDDVSWKLNYPHKDWFSILHSFQNAGIPLDKLYWTDKPVKWKSLEHVEKATN